MRDVCWEMIPVIRDHCQSLSVQTIAHGIRTFRDEVQARCRYSSEDEPSFRLIIHSLSSERRLFPASADLFGIQQSKHVHVAHAFPREIEDIRLRFGVKCEIRLCSISESKVYLEVDTRDVVRCRCEPASRSPRSPTRTLHTSHSCPL